jgi:hypothetical protein
VAAAGKLTHQSIWLRRRIQYGTFQMDSNPYAAPAESMAQAHAWRQVYRPAGTLVRLLVVGLSLIAIGDFLEAPLTVIELAMIDDFDEALEAGNPRAQAIMTCYLILAFGMSPIALAVIVVYCLWIHRANCNARALGAEGMRFTPGWSVGWFFIPLANYVMPFLAVRETCRASDPATEGQSWQDSRSPTVVGWWWLIWCLSTIALYAELALITVTEFTPELGNAGEYVVIANTPLQVAACLLCIAVVLTIHRRQEAKALLTDA